MFEAPSTLDSILDRQRRSWLSGRGLSIEELLSGTSYANDADAQLDLVYHEIVIQEDLGLSPGFDEYVSRYPHLKQDLELHFEVHRAIHGQLLTETIPPWNETTWPESGPSLREIDPPINDYQIIRQLGRGGMAVVYQARHRQLHRDVALKLFQPGRALTSREVFRIRTEAEAIARFSHPNIVQIFEIGQTEGTPFLALELAEQGTLAQRLQKSPFTADAAASLIETLARALHHAHEHHVVHRDLKPANVLFSKDGTPKITDFGLAKVLQSSDVSAMDVSLTGEVLGTPRYMSPEQTLGQHADVGPVTDVYALGTLLYECLTGQAPFVAATVVDTIQKIREDDPLPPQRLQRTVPRDLQVICLHCLEKEPQRRYATAEELADDLQRFRCGEPISARPSPAWEKSWKWCCRRPAQAALIAIVVLGTVGTLATAATKVHAESARIAGMRNDVAGLMKQGRSALDADDLELAQSKFQAAWIKVLAEPALSDHETSVTGWLDHSRNALNRYRWKQRIPPREFDHRRDEALLASVLITPHFQAPTAEARTTIQEALDLTIPKDPGWKLERTQLVLLDSKLIAATSGVAQALERLEKDVTELASREIYQYQADLLRESGRDSEADAAQRLADQFPSNAVNSLFMSGMDLLRRRQYRQALADFDDVLTAEPEHFAARLFQAICFLQLHRPAEARVALTACLAQRPQFGWSHYFRSQTFSQVSDVIRSTQDLEAALESRPSDSLKYTALLCLGELYFMQQRTTDAITAITAATNLRPQEPSGRVHLAWAELFRGQCTSADREFTLALAAQPHNTAALLGKCVLRLRPQTSSNDALDIRAF